ncbi:cytochrome-c peroxidase [Ancylothrix sp. C2]|uniref:cytochrome-c peroxidase n=1 Tax=Ancylothrix sp. D3o TaxID=2953691 RepID=UPI0021BA6B08|nr:cytochrome-c peroxidase [Ancylothrix sp. D3o]MCT7948324.1 cytochrome-c peroxidase [Ancylothrix sp. D3o]
MKYLAFGKRFSKTYFLLVTIVVAFLIVLSWPRFQKTTLNDSTEKEIPQEIVLTVNGPIQPIPEVMPLASEKVALGNKLFHEPKLSGNNQISCATCHNLSKGGVDWRKLSVGMNGTVTQFNTPTVFNSGFNFKQNWTGKANTLEQQIETSISNPRSMGSSWKDVLQKLKNEPEYVNLFRQIYSQEISKENVEDAIATFERSLFTANSRFDKFLKGDSAAITEKEKEGYRIFNEYGCVSCHQGVNVGGNLFQKFGIIGDPLANKPTPITEADLGRFIITGKEEDRHVFKVPSLRNITLTPPYFHDGSAKTLDKAIDIMAEYQLGRKLSKNETELIVKFLRTLEGEYQGNPL